MSSDPVAAAKPARSAAPSLAVLLGVAFLNMMGFGVVLPLIPYFGASLHAEAWQITALFSAYSLGQMFGEPLLGRLSDRIGRKPVLAASLLSNVAAYIALALAPDIWTATLVRLLAGFGAGNISTTQGYVADVTPPEKRAGRMGLIGAAFSFGFLGGPAVGGLLAGAHPTHADFQLPLFLSAGLCATAFLGVLAYLRESRGPADPAAPRPRFLTNIGDAVRNPVVSRVLLVTAIYMGGFSGMESTFALWAAAHFHWGPNAVGPSFLAVGLTSALFQGLITGRLARWFGEANVLTVGILLFGSSLAAQILAEGELHRWWVVPAIMCFGATGMALAMPNIAALISRSVAPDRQGAMLGLNMASGSMARVFGPLIAGVLFTWISPDAPMLAPAILAIPAAMVAVRAGRAFKKAREAHQAT
jgi:MFS family permease